MGALAIVRRLKENELVPLTFLLVSQAKSDLRLEAAEDISISQRG